MTITGTGLARNTARRGSHFAQEPALVGTSLYVRNTNPKDGPLYCTICGKLRNVCTCQRCAIMGNLIEPTSYIMRIREPLHRASVRYLQEQDYLAPPQTLHVHPFHNGAEGVGMQYTHMMLSYLDAALIERESDERIAVHAWWTSEYGIERVRRGLRSRMSAHNAEHVLEVILTLHQEEADPAEIAERYDHTVQWVMWRFKSCMDIALKRRAYVTRQIAA